VHRNPLARPFGNNSTRLRLAVRKLQRSVMFESVAPTWLWVVFIAIVIAALIIDFIVLNKQGSHVVGVKEAINWSIIWVALSFMFNGLFWWAVKDTTGDAAVANEKALEFLTGYLIEKSLAVDNIFVS
jgi:tellurite resistance protein TerC